MDGGFLTLLKTSVLQTTQLPNGCDWSLGAAHLAGGVCSGGSFFLTLLKTAVLLFALTRCSQLHPRYVGGKQKTGVL